MDFTIEDFESIDWDRLEGFIPRYPVFLKTERLMVANMIKEGLKAEEAFKNLFWDYFRIPFNEIPLGLSGTSEIGVGVLRYRLSVGK